MNQTLYNFFANDHHRIESLLDKATGSSGRVEMKYYHQFRSGLLRHIGMEEKILFPAAKKANEEIMKKLLPRFRLEHGALTALMVPPPSAALVKVIRHVLDKHDQAEEEPGGLYDVCEALTKDQTEELLQVLSKTPEVPVHPPNPAPVAVDAAKRALLRAGYDFDQIARENL